MHRHESAESLPYLERYLRLRPDDPRARLALGVARFQASQFAAACARNHRGRARRHMAQSWLNTCRFPVVSERRRRSK